MIIRKLFLIISFCAISSCVLAQKAISYTDPSAAHKSHRVKTSARNSTKEFSRDTNVGLRTSMKDNNVFSHLDIAATLGTTGIGVDLSTPLGDYVQLRTGFSYMPRFEMNSGFRVQVGDSLDKKWDKNGNRLETKFDRLSGYLKSIVGYDVDDEVTMTCKPTYYNFKLLVDAFPFRDKRWHLTAGFFVGPSEIARAYNRTEEMPSLLSVSMWNMLYDKAKNWEPIYDDYFMPEMLENKLLQYGRMGFHAGDYTHDGIDSKGNAYSKGDPYMMVPDEASGMVKAYIKVNRFKPYVGFGYGGAISKDGLTQLSFDAGVMFWGGTPSMITHDGTNLTKDVENVKGKLGRYVDAAKFFTVFPMLELRISRRIF